MKNFAIRKQSDINFDHKKQLAAILVLLLIMIFIPLAPFISGQFQHYPKTLLVVAEFLFVALLIGCWRSQKIINWVYRGLAGLVVALCVWYFIDEYFYQDKPFELPKWNSFSGYVAARGQETLWNASRAFLWFGLPCLWYLIDEITNAFRKKKKHARKRHG